MKQTIVRTGAICVAGFVAGPVAGAFTGSAVAPDGGSDATAFTSASPFAASLATLGALAIAAALGTLASYLGGRRLGLFTAGVTLAWAAISAGAVEEMIRSSRSVETLWRLSAEGAALGLATLFIAVLICRVDRRTVKKEAEEDAPRSFWMRTALGGGVCVAVAGFIAWLAAASGMHGQTFAAAVVACALGTTIGRLFAPAAHVGAFIAAAALLAAAAPALGAQMHGQAALADMFAGNLFPLARISPLDWLAGALLGVPVGASWAGSLTTKHAPHEVSLTK